MKNNEYSLRDLWNTIMWTNIYLMGVQEGEKRGRGAEHLFKEIMAENFPDLGVGGMG